MAYRLTKTVQTIMFRIYAIPRTAARRWTTKSSDRWTHVEKEVMRNIANAITRHPFGSIYKDRTRLDREQARAKNPESWI